jgi:hypothetical protein
MIGCVWDVSPIRVLMEALLLPANGDSYSYAYANRNGNANTNTNT